MWSKMDRFSSSANEFIPASKLSNAAAAREFVPRQQFKEFIPKSQTSQQTKPKEFVPGQGLVDQYAGEQYYEQEMVINQADLLYDHQYAYPIPQVVENPRLVSKFKLTIVFIEYSYGQVLKRN